jgi:hypothetical protein
MRFVPHARARPEAGDRVAAGLGEDDSVAAGAGAGTVRGRLACAGGEPAASVCPAGAAWPALDGAVIIPFSAQLAMLSNPIPATRAKNRRRQ